MGSPRRVLVLRWGDRGGCSGAVPGCEPAGTSLRGPWGLFWCSTGVSACRNFTDGTVAVVSVKDRAW